MAITYIEQFETKRAHVEMKQPEGIYAIDYVVTGPIDSTPTKVDASIVMLGEGDMVTRVGYGSYAKKGANVRFDAGTSCPIASQAAISAQFFNDLQSILV